VTGAPPQPGRRQRQNLRENDQGTATKKGEVEQPYPRFTVTCQVFQLAPFVSAKMNE